MHPIFGLFLLLLVIILDCEIDADSAPKIISKNEEYVALGEKLMHAVDYNRVAHVRGLLDRGVNVNYQDELTKYCALILASLYGHKEIVEMLLEYPRIDVNVANKFGRTSLILASRDGNVEIVEMLLKHQNINVNATDKDGDTALILASHFGHTRIVELLLKNERINVNAHGEHGYTALISASLHGCSKIVSMLLGDERVNVMAVDRVGRTASDVCTDQIIKKYIDQKILKVREQSFLFKLQNALFIHVINWTGIIVILLVLVITVFLNELK